MLVKTSSFPSPAKIKVIGLGGAGGIVISRMISEGFKGVEFIAMNTDAQALAINEAPVRFQLGERFTRGLGVGGDHQAGRKAAEERDLGRRRLLYFYPFPTERSHQIAAPRQRGKDYRKPMSKDSASSVD